MYVTVSTIRFFFYLYKTRSALYLVPTNLFVSSSQINCIVHDLDFILILGVRSRKPKISQTLQSFLQPPPPEKKLVLEGYLNDLK